jgi:hypothetical protein
MTTKNKQAKFSQPADQDASALVTVVVGVTVLSMIIASVLFSVNSSYRTIAHAANWQESLLTAETGADFAMAALRKTLSTPETAWDGWQSTDSNGQPLPNSARRYQLPSLNQHGGAGSSGAFVEVDAPPTLRDAAGQQWYRIRSTGVTILAGGFGVDADKADTSLRKMSLRWDRKSGQAVTAPLASRMVEVIARASSFENAIIAQGRIAMNSWRIDVDSFDPHDSLKSTNGAYDVAKRQENGDVATNGQIVDAGNAYIYGDVLTNAGAVTGAANVSGEQRTDFYQELLPVTTPSWSSIISSPTYIENTATLTGGTKANPNRYKLGWITLSGGKTLTLEPSSPGVDSYLEIWVTGSIALSGNGGINIKPNAHVKVFIEGDVSVTGNGIVNEAQKAVSLQLFGVTPEDGSPRSFSLSGNGSFTGAVYAPDHVVTLSGGGSNGNYFGSIVAKTVTMSGNTAVHYDESLAAGDYVTDFKVASWFEDNR